MSVYNEYMLLNFLSTKTIQSIILKSISILCSKGESQLFIDNKTAESLTVRNFSNRFANRILYNAVVMVQNFYTSSEEFTLCYIKCTVEWLMSWQMLSSVCNDVSKKDVG